jgi:large subunit ribosomal protein L10
MNKEQKAAVVEEVAGAIQAADAIFAVDYRGISVPQAKELRVALTEAGASFRVVKNTLTQRAADQAGAESLKELLEGPTAFTFVTEGGDVALAAKALATFRRQNQVLEFKGGTMNGETLTIDQIESIARLPGRDPLVGVIASPITTLVRGLASMISGLAIQLQQVAEQGLVGGGEAEGAQTAEPQSAEGGQTADGSEEPEPSEAPGDPVAEAEAAEEEPAEEEPTSENSDTEEGQ